MDTPIIEGFKAVEESRKWKEVIAAETEDMSVDEVLAYFDHDKVVKEFQERPVNAKKEI